MIVSKCNKQIKYIYSLNNKKYRDIYSRYILEGKKLVNEISSGENIPELIVYCKELLNQSNDGCILLERIKKTNTELLEVSKEVFNYIAQTVTPQGILAVVKMNITNEQDIEKYLKKDHPFIILDKIQDAGNMGTIIRSCMAFDVTNIICTVGTVDIYSPKTIRSVMGDINKINVWYMTQEKLKQVITKMKLKKYEIVATDVKANKQLSNYFATSKTVYVIGNEANGISKTIKKMCDCKIKIEMDKTQESLNVSIATGILLYDMYKKRKEFK